MDVKKMGEKLKISVLGFYGMNNYGDDLFVEIFHRALRSINFTPSFYGAVPLNNEQSKVCGIKGAKLYGLSRHLDKVLRVFNNIVAVLSARYILFGGGSVFGKYSSYPQRRLVIFIARLLNRKVSAIGVSFGPFSSSEEKNKFASLLEDAMPVIFRDRLSLTLYESCNKNNAILQEDVVFSAPRLLDDWVEEGSCYKEPYVVLAIHLEHYKESLICSAVKASQKFKVIKVVSLEKSSNILCFDIYEELKEKLADVHVEFFEYNSSSDCRRVTTTIAGADFVVTSKLHGAVVSAAFSVPFFIYEYQEKCTDFVEYINYRNFNEVDFSGPKLARARQCLQGFLAHARGVENAVHDIQSH